MKFKYDTKSLCIKKGIVVLALLSSSLAFAKETVDPVPTAPRPTVPGDGITEQAGIGGEKGFARAGVLELGGSASLTAAKNYSQVSVAPSIGWFFMDNWEITGILSWTRVAVSGSKASSTFSLLGEPSFHYPVNNSNFVFAGMGFGFAGQTGTKLGLALAPRIGYKTLVGRSGLLTIDLRNTFSNNDVIETARGSVITQSQALSVGIGYTVIW